MDLRAERMQKVVTESPSIEQSRAAAVLYTMTVHDQEPLADWISDNFNDITGWSMQEALQPGWWSEHIHPDDKQVEEFANEALLDQGYLTYEYRFQFADGSYHWLRDEMRIIHAKDCNDVQIFGVWRDVTREREILEQLQIQDQRLRQFTLNVPGMLYEFILEPDGRMYFPFSSDRIQEIYGISAEEARQDAWNAAANIHPDDVDAVVKSILDSAESLTLWRYEYRVNLPDGERWVRGEARPERRQDNSTVWHGYVMDISAEKAAERQLRMAASVFMNTHEGIMVTDNNDIIIEVNPTFTRITGYTREEAVGKPGTFLGSGRHDNAFIKGIWDSLQKHGFWQGEIWNQKKNGQVYCERKTISAVYDDNGQVLQFVGLFSDITQIKQQQQRLEQLAHYDGLTSLPNRTLLHDRLYVAVEGARRSGAQLTIVYIDLDDFKPVNDRFGHAAGDRLLEIISERLTAAVRRSDTVARIGGDEFVLLLSHESVSGYRVLLRRLQDDLAMPVEIEGHRIEISSSMGVAHFPQDADTPEILLRKADQAMYAAKQQGKNKIMEFCDLSQ